MSGPLAAPIGCLNARKWCSRLRAPSARCPLSPFVPAMRLCSRSATAVKGFGEGVVSGKVVLKADAHTLCAAYTCSTLVWDEGYSPTCTIPLPQIHSPAVYCTLRLIGEQHVLGELHALAQSVLRSGRA